MKRNTWKKTIAFVMAFTLVAGTMPVNVGGFLTGGTAIVARAEDAHQFTYTAEGNTITATCSNGDCTLPDHKVTLTITDPVNK